MTLEEAQAEILKLTDEKKILETNAETLINEKTAHEKRILELQEFNQKLFLKLTTNEPEDKKEQEISLEEFAKTIKI